MKGPHCKGLMNSQYDRDYCLMGGRSVWKGFVMRRGVSDETKAGRKAGHWKEKQ